MTTDISAAPDGHRQWNGDDRWRCISPSKPQKNGFVASSMDSHATSASTRRSSPPQPMAEPLENTGAPTTIASSRAPLAVIISKGRKPEPAAVRLENLIPSAHDVPAGHTKPLSILWVDDGRRAIGKHVMRFLPDQPIAPRPHRQQQFPGLNQFATGR